MTAAEEEKEFFSLKNRRIQKGFKTSSIFARKIGMNRSTWWMCEERNCLPRNYFLAQKVRRMLDIPPDVVSIEPLKVSYRNPMTEESLLQKLEPQPESKPELPPLQKPHILPTTASTIDLIAKLSRAMKEAFSEGNETQRTQLIQWVRTYLMGLEAGLTVRKDKP